MLLAAVGHSSASCYSVSNKYRTSAYASAARVEQMQITHSVSHLWQLISVQLQNFTLDLKQKVEAALTDDRCQSFVRL